MATIKEMLTANTADINTATELLKVLAGRDGRHVWKKYKYREIPSSSITITQIRGGGINGCIIQFSSNQIDFSTVDSTFFIGMQLKATNTGTINLLANNTAQIGTSSGRFSYNWEPLSQQMTFGFTGSTSIVWSVLSPTSIPHKEFDGYTVADIETAYPNLAVQDNYWYDKLPDNIGNMSYGTITFAAGSSSVRNLTISHGLGQIPSWFYLLESSGISMDWEGDISVVHYYLLNGAVNPSFYGGSGSGSTLTRYGSGTNGSKITATDTEISITTPYDLYTRYNQPYYWIAFK